ncbi:MAG: hypothetical protein B7Y99_11920, partial [Caulobacterales bacterium 32-69-10]
AAKPVASSAKTAGPSPKVAGRAVQADGASIPVDGAPAAAGAQTTAAVTPAASVEGEAALLAGADDAPAAPLAEPEPDAAPAATATAPAAPAPQAGTSTAAAAATAGTATHLAAQIVRKMEGRTSRFDVQLDPDGLGQVNVQVQIDARGRLSAALSFDRPEAAEALKARAGELRAALERSGFDLSGGGLSFDSRESGSSLAGDAQTGRDPASAPRRGRAFGAATETADQADLATGAAYRRKAAGGLDIRI